jgi:hypothetical protein
VSSKRGEDGAEVFEWKSAERRTGVMLRGIRDWQAMERVGNGK